MPRFRQLKKCKFYQVKGGRYFWYGDGEVTGMQDLERYCKDMVKAVAIDPVWAGSNQYVPAGVIGDDVYPFNPDVTVYTFADSIERHQLAVHSERERKREIQPLGSILHVPCVCSCGWSGTVMDCEPDVDGDGSLGCPECLEVVDARADNTQ